MNKDDVLKIIDGRTYYYTDYVYYLYDELKKRDEIIKEVREYNESILKERWYGGNEKEYAEHNLEILDKVD